jgi:hypothetical protein
MKSGNARPQGTPRTRKTIKIVEVNWRPSWEPEEGLRENEDVARMVDTWNEDNKFNPPARMTTRETNTSQTCSDRAHHRPQMGAHLAHPSETPSNSTRRKPTVLTSKRWVPAASWYETSTWAPPPHPAAVDVRAAPPTVTTRAACVYSSDGNCEGSSHLSG